MQTIKWQKGVGALAVILGLGCLAAPASANGFGAGVGLGAGGIYGFNLGAIYRNLDNRVPYFAAHPPVYYSYPVPRTYGYTPFAYPPHVATPDLGIAPAGPKMVKNPYVETAAPKAPTHEDKTVAAPQPTSGPLVIHNPYASTPKVMPASLAL